ncbi:MAG: ADP-polyphosphate phosphotransferase [Acidobacteriota bacterium]
MGKKISIGEFRVEEGTSVALKDWPTEVEPFFDSKEEYKALLKDHIGRLSELQTLLYAYNRYSLLVIFQAMDAAGKDSIIKHVMSGINPQGCQVYSFKHPGPQELQHDFLWRTTICLPERGRIGIFNRSYYEEVLIVRVHPEILAAQALPEELLEGKSLWKGRFRSITDLEAHLYRNGTRTIKFFLHVSKEEQRRRFIERIEKPEKNWKFNFGDIEERRLWQKYEEAYEDVLSRTSTEHAPWYVIPADNKANARLIVSKVILKTLKQLPMSYPQPDEKQKRDLAQIRKMLDE